MLAKFPIYANVAATDIDRARAWYEEKLDLRPEREEDGLWYRFADGTWLMSTKRRLPVRRGIPRRAGR